MKKYLLILILIISQHSYSLTFEESSHLIKKTGVGVLTEEEFHLLKNMTKKEAIYFLVNQDGGLENSFTGKISYMDAKFVSPLFISDQEKKIISKNYNECINKKSLAWLPFQTINSKFSFLDNLTLKWHNHFTISLNEINDADIKRKMVLNNILKKRYYGNKNFKDLAKNMIYDWATIIYLDAQENIKTQMNNNFSRELLELFLLGEGYSDKDVYELSKALTGIKVEEDKYYTYFDWGLHNKSDVYFMGKNYKSDINIRDKNIKFENILKDLFEKPELHKHITKTVWGFYINKEIPNDKLKKLSAEFKQNLDLKDLIRSVLLTEEFWSKDNIKEKSPYELIFGTIRFLKPKYNNIDFYNEGTIKLEEDLREISEDRFNYYPKGNLSTISGNCILSKTDKKTISLINELLSYTSIMGQDIYSPPSVSGWNYSDNWIKNSNYIYTSSEFFANIKYFIDLNNISIESLDFLAKQHNIDYKEDKNNKIKYLNYILLNDNFFFK